jgi:K+-sensing histidine kinase KdpD
MVDTTRPGARIARSRPAVRTAAALMPLATCAILSTVRESVTAETSVLVLVLWVVTAAASGDRVAGILAALSGAAWFDFFLTEPYLRFTIADPDDVEATVLLVLISLAVTEVALWGHRQQAQAARRSGYLGGVLGAARAVAEGDTPTTTVIEVVARQIGEVLGADECRFVEGAVHDARVALLDHDGVLTRGGHPIDVKRVGLPYDEYVAVPVRRGTRVAGHFLVSATTRHTYPSSEQRRVAVLLADQVAVALHDGSS